MRKRIVLALAVIALLSLHGLQDQANPIIEGYLNEILLTSSSWNIEMHLHAPMTLDGWSLSSRSGSALFKSGIHVGDFYTVITPDSLLSSLSVAAAGDSITLHSPQYPMAQLSFGDGGWIAAPRGGQSICMKESGTQYYYLDNTPTLGQQNDGLNATGVVRGRVTDTLGQPISNAIISWDSFPVQHAYSDSAGVYSITEFARPVTFTFSQSGFRSENVSVQVWPESTQVVNVVLRVVSDVGEDGQHRPGPFKLWVNYPNPFNPSTMVNYRIPLRSHVVLSVFDVGGKEIARLVDEMKDPGDYSQKWDASGSPSGVYFCRMQSGGYEKTVKMVLVR
jgi:hypothetical protein